jgi:hypothetical protein
MENQNEVIEAQAAPAAADPNAQRAQEPQPQQPQPDAKTLAQQLHEAHELLAQERQKSIQDRAQHEADQDSLRAQLARAQARGNSGQQAPSSGWQARTRAQAIASTGGLAFWNKLDLNQKLHRMGEQPATEAEVQLARRLFSGNAAAEASRYHNADPVAYVRLRLIHQEL